MKLASVSEIRDSLGFSDMPDINDQISSALDNAEAYISSRIDTDMAQASMTDVFLVDEPGAVAARIPRTEFRLSRGFVTGIQSLTYTTPAPGFANGSWYIPATPINTPDPQSGDLSSTISLDAEKGVLRDRQTFFRSNILTAVYTAGFPVDPEDEDGYDLTQVPSWLQEAARVYAMMELADLPSLTQAEIKLDTKGLRSRLEMILSRKVRYAPTALLPD